MQSVCQQSCIFMTKIMNVFFLDFAKKVIKFRIIAKILVRNIACEMIFFFKIGPLSRNFLLNEHICKFYIHAKCWKKSLDYYCSRKGGVGDL